MTQSIQFNEKQKAFLKKTKEAGIDPSLFGQFIPEIRYEPEKYEPRKPTIAYIHTGGTLAMVPSKNNEGALSFQGAIDIGKAIDICDAIAGIKSRYNIIGIHLANIDSKEVSSELWTALATTIRTIYNDVDGVVIGHGTHTLEYSAAAISYALRDLAIPIIFAASQIPLAHHPGSDGFGNLTGAMEIAANGNIAEVVTYMHGDINRGSRVRKKNDKRLDGFESPVTGPIGHFTAVGVEVKPGARPRGYRQKYELVFQPKFDPSVTTLKMNPETNEKSIQGLVDESMNYGLILECYGSAAIPNSWIDVLKPHLDRGYPIFLSSSCAESGISPEMEEHDEDALKVRKAGIMTVRDMSTAAACVKLMNIMASIKDVGNKKERLERIKKEMLEKNYAAEITLTNRAADF